MEIRLTHISTGYSVIKIILVRKHRDEMVFKAVNDYKNEISKLEKSQLILVRYILHYVLNTEVFVEYVFMILCGQIRFCNFTIHGLSTKKKTLFHYTSTIIILLRNMKLVVAVWMYPKSPFSVRT